jgi:hypothetical protein
MFASEMKDANEHLLEMPDASPDAIRAVLEYMYSDCIPEYLLQSFATAVEVFQLADRWDLDRLTELVVPLISRHLSVANVFAALQFAETHKHSAGGARLRRVAIEFSRQHFEDVIDDGTAKIRKLQAALLESHGVTVDLTEAEPTRAETYSMPARELNASQPASTSTASLPFPGPTSSTGGGIMGISRSLFPLSAFSGITGSRSSLTNFLFRAVFNSYFGRNALHGYGFVPTRNVRAKSRYDRFGVLVDVSGAADHGRITIFRFKQQDFIKQLPKP